MHEREREREREKEKGKRKEVTKVREQWVAGAPSMCARVCDQVSLLHHEFVNPSTLHSAHCRRFRVISISNHGFKSQNEV
jgi:hypothetical protein